MNLCYAFASYLTTEQSNTIILAANYREEDGLIEEDEDKKWRFEIAPDSQTGVLVISGPAKLAPVIDGQHRLFGFNFASIKGRLDTPLLSAIYFDLPKPYQAFLFATINANQRPVSKSQTYELFGYNVEEEPPDRWTPEKLCVFLARKLNTEADSPFQHKIIIGAENDLVPSLAEARKLGEWAVSTATVVEGIVKLISSNPKLDAYATVSVDFFSQRLKLAQGIDFADRLFQASGTGRTLIRTALELAIGLRPKSDLSENPRLRRDAAEYRRVLGWANNST